VSDYWAPQCDGNCFLPGASGRAYLGLDALINGNGAGFENVDGILQDPTKPYNAVTNPYVVQPWGVSAVNYFYEASLSTGIQYMLQKPFAAGGPLENQQIFNSIAQAFQIGSGNLFVAAFVNTLATIAVAAESIPGIGPYLFHGIGSYIGPNFQTIDTIYDSGNYAGWSGVFRYIGGVITTGGDANPYPTALPQSAAAVAALSSPVAAAKSASPDTGTATPEVEVPAPKAGETPSDDSTPADSTPAAGDSSESTSTEAASDTKPADTKPADTTPAVDSPSTAVADSTADATPAATKPADASAKASKRPARKAAERAAKKIASAISGAAKAASASVSGS
jgi:hypothetical protein